MEDDPDQGGGVNDRRAQADPSSERDRNLSGQAKPSVDEQCCIRQTLALRQRRSTVQLPCNLIAPSAGSNRLAFSRSWNISARTGPRSWTDPSSIRSSRYRDQCLDEHRSRIDLISADRSETFKPPPNEEKICAGNHAWKRSPCLRDPTAIPCSQASTICRTGRVPSSRGIVGIHRDPARDTMPMDVFFIRASLMDIARHAAADGKALDTEWSQTSDLRRHFAKLPDRVHV